MTELLPIGGQMSKDTERAIEYARSIQEKMTKRLNGRRTVNRSASTGRFVSNAAAARNPTSSVTDRSGQTSVRKAG
ncbi:hypothetical protein C5C20_09800 [Rathayibacter rathayi]|uniref:Uncharacterized protein n=2 Tax=Rathayibacter rathayi TaxID=33887 RepID=A0ABD6W8L3_RATRA|nr:hypothetical protein C5C04_09360 [Rathayibacter rathayi]PPF23732.1 hypothetical protein C5C34_07535 [Rathayibacter rathayi]PPF79945.1 hypothetical protein C5C14_07615 [Rathayibacter rathayi]PPG13059.1 hypothetical protein C5C11_07995 [Rathayibacter rathayi]PPG42390.1 hypothetical protein C5C20_09800 [Rathayibacter rathayi]